MPEAKVPRTACRVPRAATHKGKGLVFVRRDENRERHVILVQPAQLSTAGSGFGSSPLQPPPLSAAGSGLGSAGIQHAGGAPYFP